MPLGVLKDPVSYQQKKTVDKTSVTYELLAKPLLDFLLQQINPTSPKEC